MQNWYAYRYRIVRTKRGQKAMRTWTFTIKED